MRGHEMKRTFPNWKTWAGALLVFASHGLLVQAPAAEDAQAYLKRAEALYAEGKLPGAIIELKNALEQNPSLGEARRLLGRIYLKNRDGAAAEKELRRAQSLGPDDLQVRLDLAEAYLLQGRFGEVLSTLPKDGGSPQEQARARLLEGGAHLGLKDLDQAQQSFQMALKADPQTHQAELGLVQLALLRDQPEQARARLADLVKRAPEYLDALLVKAELERKDGQLEQALASFSQALERAPGDARALLGRATTYAALGRLDEASADLDQADKAAPGLVMGEYLRGLVAFQRKALDEARERLQKVLSAMPEHLPSQLMLGVIGYAKGEYQSANEYLTRVVAAMPNNPTVLKVLAATRIKLKEPRQAIEILEPAVRAAPQDAQLLALLGSAYLLGGDHAKGADTLQQAVELEPNLAALRTQLALGLLAEGDAQAALTQLQGAVDLGQDLLQADVLLVLTHLKQQQYAEALKASQALEQRMADSPIPYNLTGLAYLAQGDKDKARERFQQALKIDPKFQAAELNLARVDLGNQDLDGAERRFKAILDQDANSLGAYLGLAGIAEQRKDTPAMVQWLERAQDKNPQAVQPAALLVNHYLTNQEPLKALKVASNLNGRLPDAPASLELLGRAQLAAGEPASAVRGFQRLAELKPIPEAYLLLAGAQMETRDWDGARKTLKRGLAQQPDLLRAQLMLGLLELRAGFPAAAQEVAREVQLKHPKEAGGYELEGRAHLAQQEPAKAASAFEKAYALQATGGLASALAQVYQDLKRPDEAVRILDDWLRQQPKDPRARMQLAMLYQTQNRRDEAIRAYEAVHAEQPDDGILLNNLAWLYFEVKDPRALELAAKAHEKAPDRAEVLDTYGWVLLHQGQAKDRERALALLQQAYVAQPTNQDIGYHVAYGLHQAGRPDEARRTLQRVLKEGDRFGEAAAARDLAKQLGL